MDGDLILCYLLLYSNFMLSTFSTLLFLSYYIVYYCFPFFSYKYALYFSLSYCLILYFYNIFFNNIYNIFYSHCFRNFAKLFPFVSILLFPIFFSTCFFSSLLSSSTLFIFHILAIKNPFFIQLLLLLHLSF